MISNTKTRFIGINIKLLMVVLLFCGFFFSNVSNMFAATFYDNGRNLGCYISTPSDTVQVGQQIVVNFWGSHVFDMNLNSNGLVQGELRRNNEIFGPTYERYYPFENSWAPGSRTYTPTTAGLQIFELNFWAGDGYYPDGSATGDSCSVQLPVEVLPNSIQLGTVCVGSVVPTTWTVSGPTNYPGSGGSQCNDVPAGTYTVNAAPLSGYSGPTYSPSQTRTVVAGQMVGIDVVYTYTGGGTGGSGGGTGGGTGGTGGGSISCLVPNSAIRNCSNYTEWAPVYQASASACATYCSQNNANACEWNSGSGSCYAEFGSGCQVQSGFSGWYAGVAGASCAAPSQATLNVNSSGASGVSISRVSGTSSTNGTTNYTRTNSSNISTVLRAPATSGSTNFSSWSGCNSVGGTGNRDCTVSVSTGQTKTITANYSTPTSACDTTYYQDQFRVCYFDGTSAPTGSDSAIYQTTETTLPSSVGALEPIDNNWGDGIIAAGKSDNVSAVWRGKVNFQNGTYVFHTISDDGVRLVVDGSEVISNWSDHAPTQNDSAPISLSGQKDVMLRWYEKDGGAEINLWWDFTPASPAATLNVTSSGASGVSISRVSGTSGTEGTTNYTRTSTLPTSGWTFCANEDQNCSFSGEKLVRYGANGSYYYQLRSSSVSCSNATFGDPIVGTEKQCHYNSSGYISTVLSAPSTSGGLSFLSWSGCDSVAGVGNINCTISVNTGVTKTITSNYGNSFNYSLSNSGNSSVTKTSGNAFTQNTITKTLTSGSSQSVTLAVSGVPSGTSYSISNSTCSPTCNSVITFTVSPNTPAGTYPITVTGSPLSKTTNFNLIVSGNTSSVTCSASPTTALIGQNVTWTANVTGGTPPFTYVWSGTNIPTSPAPNTNPFNISYSTLGQKTATVTVTDSDSLQATCPLGTTVQVNFNPVFEEF